MKEEKFQRYLDLGITPGFMYPGMIDEPEVDDSLDECYACGRTVPADQLDHRGICPGCPEDNQY